MTEKSKQSGSKPRIWPAKGRSIIIPHNGLERGTKPEPAATERSQTVAISDYQ